MYKYLWNFHVHLCVHQICCVKSILHVFFCRRSPPIRGNMKKEAISPIIEPKVSLYDAKIWWWPRGVRVDIYWKKLAWTSNFFWYSRVQANSTMKSFRVLDPFEFSRSRNNSTIYLLYSCFSLLQVASEKVREHFWNPFSIYLNNPFMFWKTNRAWVFLLVFQNVLLESGHSHTIMGVFIKPVIIKTSFILKSS